MEGTLTSLLNQKNRHLRGINRKRPRIQRENVSALFQRMRSDSSTEASSSDDCAQRGAWKSGKYGLCLAIFSLASRKQDGSGIYIGKTSSTLAERAHKSAPIPNFLQQRGVAASPYNRVKTSRTAAFTPSGSKSVLFPQT